MKETVEGIILVLSCNKHKNTRLKEFKIPEDTNLHGYKVIYVIADLFLNKNYVLDDTGLLTIKCEDSYIHLFKKLVLSLKYVYEIFNIKQGVLRCGDDLIFNKVLLENFLQIKDKPDLYGYSPSNRGYDCQDKSNYIDSRDDYFMWKYYCSHREDFNNPLHNLQNVYISKYIKRPKIDIGVEGVLFYISNKSCKILIDTMDCINYDVFHPNVCRGITRYPYTIEDCATSFVLFSHNIPLIFDYTFNGRHDISQNLTICQHTNKYK